MISTTELLIEHIISGLLSLLWISALSLSILGFDHSILTFVADKWEIIVLFSICISYPIGLFMDTIIDKLLDSRSNQIKSKYFTKESGIHVMKLILKHDNENLTNYFTYNRFKIRISRSAFINFILISFSLPIFILTNSKYLSLTKPNTVAIVVLLIFLLFAGASYFTWYQSTDRMHEKTNDLWEL